MVHVLQAAVTPRPRLHRPATLVGALVLTAALAACDADDAAGWDWGLPDGVEAPPEPADNPMDEDRVELGRWLFYDTELSLENNRACGVCHEQAKAFSDGLPRAIGTTGELHPHNSPGLTNVAYTEQLNWADPSPQSLEHQLLGPLLGTSPIVEMGMGGREAELLERLRLRPEYDPLFDAAFPDAEEPLSIEHIALAIASFQRTLLSWNSPWDHHVRGDAGALDASQQRGLALFFGEAGCSRCHGGPNLDAPDPEDASVVAEPRYANVGLYDLDGAGAYPVGQGGLANATGDASDTGRFRIPGLRNVAITRPYMHDGSVDTLEHAVRIMAEGGRVLTSGPNVGDGQASPLKDPRLQPVELDEQQLADLVAFLEALTDQDFLDDERIASPYPPFMPEFPPGTGPGAN